MLYQTIVLELIQHRPALCALLRKERLMLRATQLFARELKNSQENWDRKLSHSMRGVPKAMIESRAKEFALEELLNRLPPESASTGPTPEEVLSYVRANST